MPKGEAMSEYGFAWTFRDDTLSTIEKPHYTFALLTDSEGLLYHRLKEVYGRDRRSAEVLKLTPVKIRICDVPLEYRKVDFGY